MLRRYVCGGRSGLTWRLLTGKGRTREGRDAGRPLTVLLVLVSVVVHLSKRHVLLASLVRQVKTKKEDEKKRAFLFFFCPLFLAEKERKGKGI